MLRLGLYIKFFVIFFILMILFLYIGALPLQIVTNTMMTQANASGIADQTGPILTNIGLWFTALGAICGIGMFVILFAAIYGTYNERDQYGQQ